MNAPQTPSVFALAGEFAALNDLLDGLDTADNADVVATIRQWVTELDGHAAVKLEGVGRFIDIQRAAADFDGQRAAALQERASKAKRKADRMKDAVVMLMQAAGIKGQFKTETYTFAVVGNGGPMPLDVDDVDPLVVAPTDPDLVVTTTTINKDAVRKRLEAGQSLPFARLLPRGQHLRIK